MGREEEKKKIQTKTNKLVWGHTEQMLLGLDGQKRRWNFKKDMNF